MVVPKRYQNSLVIGLVVLAILNLCFKQYSKAVLPIYNSTDFNPLLVDKTLQGKNKNHKVSNFTLINQNGEIITQKDFEGKIYVADFFFTKCPTICPIMANHMWNIQEAFKHEDDVMLLSLSVTPNIDNVAVLKKYALEKGVNDQKWHITTGDKKHIYELARQSYFAVTEQGDGGLQDFIHTPYFILVDKKKQIRGLYDGTKPQEIQRIINDITKLKSEFISS